MSVSTFKGIISIGEGTEVKVWSDSGSPSPLFQARQGQEILTSAVADISSSICLAPCGIPGDLFSWVCWNLWIARNKLFFKARLAFVQTTATKTLAGAIEWTHAQDPHVATPKNTLIPVRPQLIPVGTVTCNTDANWKKKTSVAGLAWIFDSSPPLITSDS
ncbi:hypothetical protein F2Q68_00031945 [Brassica cretica]|uniref:Uncharacterized protein n=1 Tax=Brassica cretica TaxID=69181 RepID=A0A8S9G6N6_BRACR|nr:hypothetical protein F2Q68_00031945 [Brassica cretica]